MASRESTFLHPLCWKLTYVQVFLSRADLVTNSGGQDPTWSDWYHYHFHKSNSRHSPFPLSIPATTASCSAFSSADRLSCLGPWHLLHLLSWIHFPYSHNKHTTSYIITANISKSCEWAESTHLVKRLGYKNKLICREVFGQDEGAAQGSGRKRSPRRELWDRQWDCSRPLAKGGQCWTLSRRTHSPKVLPEGRRGWSQDSSEWERTQ